MTAVTQHLHRPAPPPPRHRWRAWVTAAVVAALVAGGIGVHQWLTGEHLFSDQGAGDSGPLPVGRTMYFGLGPLMPEGQNPNGTHRVDLRSVRPVVTTNSSAATVVVLLCVARGGGSNLVAGGTALDDPTPYCTSIRPFQAGPVTLGPTATGIVLAITPHRRGVVQVDGAQISYRQGIRSGQQRIRALTTTATTP